MILKKFQHYFQNELKSIYPKTEIDSFFTLILENQLNLKRIDVIVQPNIEITSENLKILKKITFRLKQEEPIQYILEKTEFFGLPFSVSKKTLIPRPETEELVAWIIKEVKKIQCNNLEKLSILDIGTGSGCIPVSLKKHLTNVEIFALDISSAAIKMAKENATLNKVSITFFESDVLSTTELPKTFDIIVSNPPYVREQEKEEMKKNVLQNEPHLALFVSNKNPLLFYDKIADLAINQLTKKGVLFFEINQYLAKETMEMLTERGFNKIELRKDIFGNDRMLKAQFE